MKYGRIAAMMSMILASSMNGSNSNVLEFKPKPTTPLVPFNRSASWHPQASRSACIVGAAKQRRASIKQRNINRQKRHANYRSAKSC